MEKKGLAEVNGHSVYYEMTINGNEPWVVFLHEGLGSVPQWKNFPQDFCRENHYSCFVYDRYGHGKSSMLNEKRSNDFVFEQADELNTILKTVGISEKYFLFGHSDGATIALIHAARFPDQVLAVVSEAAHVVIEEHSRQGLLKAKEMFETGGKLKQGLERYHGEKTESMFHGWADTWLREDFREWTMFDTLRNITSPVLAVQGDHDEYGTYHQLEMIKAHVNGPCELLWIP